MQETGFNPWSGAIPHAAEQLSPRATSTEHGSCKYRAHVPQVLKPASPRACALQPERPALWEASARELERRPTSPPLETSVPSIEDPAQPKVKINKIFFKKIEKKWCLSQERKDQMEFAISRGSFSLEGFESKKDSSLPQAISVWSSMKECSWTRYAFKWRRQ